MPPLINQFDDANFIWQETYHFTGTVERATGAPEAPKDFKILSQSIVGGTMVPCDSDIFVSKP